VAIPVYATQNLDRTHHSMMAPQPAGRDIHIDGIISSMDTDSATMALYHAS
jgi:hypothetical protein